MTTGAKADIGKRIGAALIDGVLAMVVSRIPLIGGIIAAAYFLVRDGLELDFMKHRSIGKQLLKLKVVRADGQPMDIATSVKRNVILCVGYIGMVFMIIPVLGWIVAGVIGVVALALALVELFFVVTDPQGRRIGDKMADTTVVEETAP